MEGEIRSSSLKIVSGSSVSLKCQNIVYILPLLWLLLAYLLLLAALAVASHKPVPLERRLEWNDSLVMANHLLVVFPLAQSTPAQEDTHLHRDILRSMLGFRHYPIRPQATWQQEDIDEAL